MTEAMPFLKNTILLSYDPRPFGRELFAYVSYSKKVGRVPSRKVFMAAYKRSLCTT